MPASTLKDAFNLFDPRRPLENGELDTLYVSRPHAPLKQLEAYLRNTNQPVAVLFSGHRGSGKSTELRRLGKDLDNEFLVVSVSVSEALNIADLNYADVTLACAIALIHRVIANEEYVPLHEVLLSSLLTFFTNEITTEKIIATPVSGSVSAKLNVYFASLEGKISKETTTRQTVREKLFPRLTDLISQVKQICETVRAQTGKMPLIIVEDIDKSDLAHARDLFFNHSSTLTSLDCHVIYTFSISLCYANEFTERIGDYSKDFKLPNVSLYTIDDQPEAVGHQVLRDVVNKRADTVLFTDEALNTIITLSGGLLRNLIRLVRDAALNAITEEAAVIDVEAVEEVGAEIRNDFRRILLPQHYEALRKAHKTKQIVADEIGRQLLENLSLLEYRNGDAWCDAQPIV